MLILRAGLYLGVVIVAWVTWASISAGYAVEVALLRGLVAMPPVVFVAYLGELVVATAPPRRMTPATGATSTAVEELDPVLATATPNARTPVNLPTGGERVLAKERREAA